MIEPVSLTIRNFLSYGDYDTTIDLSNRGQCFIHGRVIDNVGDEDVDRSNGAGKSSLTQSMLWCLSGKTMHDKNPGDGIRCWFNDKNTVVSIKFRDGSELIRARTSTSDTELIYSKDGRELIHSALSTTPNQQAELNRLLNFDFDIYCGSVFSSQYKKKWMEMSDQHRKKVLERVMGVDRLTVYAEIAKKKRDRTVIEQDKLSENIAGLDKFINDLNEQLDTNIKSFTEFKERQSVKCENKMGEVREIQDELDEFESIDIDVLKTKWVTIDKVNVVIKKMAGRVENIGSLINDMDMVMNGQIAGYNSLEKQARNEEVECLKKLAEITRKALKDADSAHDEQRNEFVTNHNGVTAEYNTKQRAVTTQIAAHTGYMDTNLNKIKAWEEKNGEMCLECEQDIPDKHISNKTSDIRTDIRKSETKIDELNKDLETIEDTYQKAYEAHGRILDNLDRTISQEKEKVNERAEKASEEAAHECDGAVGVARDMMCTAKKERDERVSKLEVERTKLKNQILAASEKVSNHKPDQTVDEAELYNTRSEELSRSIIRLKKEVANILEEPNPHTTTTDDLKNRVTDYEDDRAKLQRQLEQYDMIYKHLNYVYRAYSDRRKIKSWCISKHRPYFNSRIDHYLDSFDLDLRISITDSLAIDSNMWKPAYQSGGERARTDLAFMFAVFDLHNGIHGKQSNMLVLDEPDEGLDEAGVRSLTNIIKDELASRFETILVISHRGALKDVFPSQITVERIDRLSHISDSR